MNKHKMRIPASKLAFILLLLFSMAAPAADDNAVLNIITAPEVKEMMEKDNVLLINSLTNIEYTIQHIPDSINIPLLEMDRTDKLPKNKDTAIIFYCMGRRCLFSEKASRKAIEMGYTNVYWFEGGIPDWYRFNYPMVINEEMKSVKVKKLSPVQVDQLLKEQQVTVIDVKPEWWTATGTGVIPGTYYHPLITLHSTYQQIPDDKPVIITDGIMRQSPSAARFLISKGYNVLGVLKGGMTRWEKEGFYSVPTP